MWGVFLHEWLIYADFWAVQAIEKFILRVSSQRGSGIALINY